jgi:hypothetical protein
MEFDAEVQGKNYHFSPINGSSVLVSGGNAEYILYKNKIWRCADELSSEILEELGDIIDEHMHVF